jgi:hypothetical protein
MLMLLLMLTSMLTPVECDNATESVIRLGRLDEPDNIALSLVHSPPHLLVLHMMDKVHLRVYERRFTEDDVATLPDGVASVAFLHTLLCDVFGEADEVLDYRVEAPDGRSPHAGRFRFTVKNTYRYAAFEFAFDVPQKDLRKREQIVLRLDKALADNEALRQSVREIREIQRQSQQQLLDMAADVRHARDLEHFRSGVSIRTVLGVLGIIHSRPETQAHWERTRSFGGLDHVVPTGTPAHKCSHGYYVAPQPPEGSGGNYWTKADWEPVHALVAGLCDAPSVTYRRAALKALEVFEQQSGRPLKSYHYTPPPKQKGFRRQEREHDHLLKGARLVHDLSREKATEVSVTLTVPKGISRRAAPFVLVNIRRANPNDPNDRGPINTYVPQMTEHTPETVSQRWASDDVLEGCPPSLDGSTWTLQWDSVDQRWQVTDGAEQMASCPYRTDDDIPAEYRARGVRFRYTVLRSAGFNSTSA